MFKLYEVGDEGGMKGELPHLQASPSWTLSDEPNSAFLQRAAVSETAVECVGACLSWIPPLRELGVAHLLRTLDLSDNRLRKVPDISGCRCARAK
jgi:hypothetical protein